MTFDGTSQALLKNNTWDMDYLKKRATITGYKIYLGTTLAHEVQDARKDLTQVVVRFNQNNQDLKDGQIYDVGVRVINQLQEISSTSTTIEVQISSEGVFQGFKFEGISNATSDEHGKALITWDSAKWESVFGAEEEQPLGYRIYSGINFEKMEAAVDPKLSEYILLDLKEGTPTSFGVRVVDQKGNEDPNNKTITIDVLDLKPPDFEGITEAVYNSELKAILLKWHAPLEKVSTYSVFYSHTADGFNWQETNLDIRGKTDTTIDLLSPALVGSSRIGDEWDYYFAVRSSDTAGNMDTNIKSLKVSIPDIREPQFDGIAEIIVTSGQAKIIFEPAIGGTDNYQLFMAKETDDFNFLMPERRFKLPAPEALENNTKTTAAVDPNAVEYYPITVESDGRLSVRYDRLLEGVLFKFVVRAVDASKKSSVNDSYTTLKVDDLTAPEFQGIHHLDYFEMAGSSPEKPIYSETSLKIFWNPSIDQYDRKKDVAKYQIYMATKEGIITADIEFPNAIIPITEVTRNNDAMMSYTIQGLEPDTEYCFVVDAVDKSENHSANFGIGNPMSGACISTPDMTPPAFPGVSNMEQLSGGYIKITWIPGTDDVAEYLVYVSRDPIKAQSPSYFYNPLDRSAINFVSVKANLGQVILSELTDQTRNDDNSKSFLEMGSYYVLVKSRDVNWNIDINNIQINFTMKDMTAPTHTPIITNCTGAQETININCQGEETCTFDLVWSAPGDGQNDAKPPADGGIAYYVVYNVTGLASDQLGEVGTPPNGSIFPTDFIKTNNPEMTSYSISTNNQGVVRYVVHAFDLAGNENLDGVDCTLTLPDRSPPRWYNDDGTESPGQPKLKNFVETDPAAIRLTWNQAKDDNPISDIFYTLYKTSVANAINYDTTTDCTEANSKDPDDTFLSENTCKVDAQLVNAREYIDTSILINKSYKYAIRAKDQDGNQDNNLINKTASVDDIFAPTVKLWVIEPVLTATGDNKAISMYWYIEDIPKENDNIKVTLCADSKPDFECIPNVNTITPSELKNGVAILHRNPNGEPDTRQGTWEIDFLDKGYDDSPGWAIEYDSTLGKNCKHQAGGIQNIDCTYKLNEDSYPLLFEVAKLSSEGYNNAGATPFDEDTPIYFRLELYDNISPQGKRSVLSYPVVWNQQTAMAFVDRQVSGLNHSFWIDKYEAHIPAVNQGSIIGYDDAMQFSQSYMDASSANKYNYRAQSISSKLPAYGLPFDVTVLACEHRGLGFAIPSPKEWYEGSKGTATTVGVGTEPYECNTNNLNYDQAGSCSSPLTSAPTIKKSLFLNQNCSKAEVTEQRNIRVNSTPQLIGYKCVSQRGVYDMIGNVSEYVDARVFIGRDSSSNRYIAGINPFTGLPQGDHYLTQIMMDPSHTLLNDLYDNNTYGDKKIEFNSLWGLPDFRIGSETTLINIGGSNTPGITLPTMSIDTAPNIYLAIKDSNYTHTHGNNQYTIEGTDFTRLHDTLPTDSGLNKVGFRCRYINPNPGSLRTKGSTLEPDVQDFVHVSQEMVDERCNAQRALPYNQAPIILGFKAKPANGDNSFITLEFQVTDDYTRTENLEVFIYRDSTGTSPNDTSLIDGLNSKFTSGFFLSGNDKKGSFTIQAQLDNYNLTAVGTGAKVGLSKVDQTTNYNTIYTYKLFVRDESCAISEKEIMFGVVPGHDMVPIKVSSKFNMGAGAQTFWIDRTEQVINNNSVLNYYEAWAQCALRNENGTTGMPDADEFHFRLAKLNEWEIAASQTPVAPPFQLNGPGKSRNYGVNSVKTQFCHNADLITNTLASSTEDKTRFCTSYYSAHNMIGNLSEWVDMQFAYSGTYLGDAVYTPYEYESYWKLRSSDTPKFKVSATGIYERLVFTDGISAQFKTDNYGLPSILSNDTPIGPDFPKYATKMFDNIAHENGSGEYYQGWGSGYAHMGTLGLQVGGAIVSGRTFKAANNGQLDFINRQSTYTTSNANFWAFSPFQRINMFDYAGTITSTTVKKLNSYRCVWAPDDTANQKYHIVSLATERRPGWQGPGAQILLTVQVAPEFNAAQSLSSKPIQILSPDTTIKIKHTVGNKTDCPASYNQADSIPNQGIFVFEIGSSSIPECQTGMNNPYGFIEAWLVKTSSFDVDSSHHKVYASAPRTDYAAGDANFFDMVFVPGSVSGLGYDYYIDRYEASKIQSSSYQTSSTIKNTVEYDVANSQKGMTPWTGLSWSEAQIACARRTFLFRYWHETGGGPIFPDLTTASYSNTGTASSDWRFRLATNPEWYAASKGVSVHGKDRFLSPLPGGSSRFKMNGANVTSGTALATGYTDATDIDHPDTTSATSDFGVWNMGGNVREYVDFRMGFKKYYTGDPNYYYYQGASNETSSCCYWRRNTQYTNFTWSTGSTDMSFTMSDVYYSSDSASGLMWNYTPDDHYPDSSQNTKIGIPVLDVFSRHWLPTASVFGQGLGNQQTPRYSSSPYVAWKGLFGTDATSTSNNKPDRHYSKTPENYDYDGNYFIIDAGSSINVTTYRIAIRGGSFNDFNFEGAGANPTVETGGLSPKIPLWGVHSVNITQDMNASGDSRTGFRCVMINAPSSNYRSPGKNSTSYKIAP